ncbi:MAG TPA: SIMPL domain-containing protein [Rhizomicrobium sp.]
MSFRQLGFRIVLPLVLLAPVLAHAQAAEPESRLLTATGQGEVKAKPDQATLSAGVLTDGKTAGDALAANSRAMNQVFATLKRFGIADRAIQTSNFSVTPQYPDYNSKQPRRIIGYQVSNNVTVTVDNLDRVGPALDALVASGANSLGDVSFSVRDPKPLEAQARADAVQDATAKAAAMAHAAGVALGPIVFIGEGDISAPAMPMRRMMAAAPMAAAAPPPVAAGEESVTASVTVTWEIH